MNNVISLILGGGKGTRLYPLTKDRSKAAVPFGGKYRLIDIAISNCINSGFRKVFVLTQFNSYSLHNHVTSTFQFDQFSRGFVKILAAEQTLTQLEFHQGTADAVRKAYDHFRSLEPDHFMILAGDQLYRMNFEKFFDHHRKSGSDISIASCPITREEAGGLGILSSSKEGWVNELLEKPDDSTSLDAYEFPRELHPHPEKYDAGQKYLGSMGIYLFSNAALKKSLEGNRADFGKEVLPEAINKNFRVSTHVFTGFWQDLGTIKNFYQANIGLTTMNPDFNLYDPAMPIYTRNRVLPPTKLNFSTISQSLACDGCIITNASVMNSLLGIRSVIDSGANLDGVVMMGADYFEGEEKKRRNFAEGVPHVGVGRGTLIKKTIIDKNARIGDGCRIGVDNLPRPDQDRGFYFIKDGIIVIPKGSVVPSGTII